MIFSESWVEAESYVFDKFCTELASKPRETAWLGVIEAPCNGAWMLSTGGSDLAQAQEMLAANGRQYSGMAFSGEMQCLYVNRADAQRWAMAVMDTFRKFGNFAGKHNINFFHPISYPESPSLIEIAEGVFMWSVRIPVQLVFRTDAVLS